MGWLLSRVNHAVDHELCTTASAALKRLVEDMYKPKQAQSMTWEKITGDTDHCRLFFHKNGHAAATYATLKYLLSRKAMNELKKALGAERLEAMGKMQVYDFSFLASRPGAPVQAIHRDGQRKGYYGAILYMSEGFSTEVCSLRLTDDLESSQPNVWLEDYLTKFRVSPGDFCLFEETVTHRGPGNQGSENRYCFFIKLGPAGQSLELSPDQEFRYGNVGPLARVKEVMKNGELLSVHQLVDLGMLQTYVHGILKALTKEVAARQVKAEANPDSEPESKDDLMNVDQGKESHNEDKMDV